MFLFSSVWCGAHAQSKRVSIFIAMFGLWFLPAQLKRDRKKNHRNGKEVEKHFGSRVQQIRVLTMELNLCQLALAFELN